MCGLNSDTKPFVPAFEIIKMREGLSRVSSVFIMVWPERVLFYADCSVNIIAPTQRPWPRSGAPRRPRGAPFGYEPKVASSLVLHRDSAKHEKVGPT